MEKKGYDISLRDVSMKDGKIVIDSEILAQKIQDFEVNPEAMEEDDFTLNFCIHLF